MPVKYITTLACIFDKFLWNRDRQNIKSFLLIKQIKIWYIILSYNLSELANQNQALRRNTSRYFIPKMSVFNTSKVLCNSHVMFVYIIIVHYC